MMYDNLIWRTFQIRVLLQIKTKQQTNETNNSGTR